MKKERLLENRDSVESLEFVCFCNLHFMLLHRYNASAALLGPFPLRHDSFKKRTNKQAKSETCWSRAG